jgi:hypothetical protein
MWSLKKEKMVAQFGYFQDWEGRGDIDVLNYGERTWMSSARDEVDSQTPHVAAAFGHTVLMGAGMGIALFNLLSKPDPRDAQRDAREGEPQRLVGLLFS